MKVAVTAASGQLGSTIIRSTSQWMGKANIIALARTPQKAEHLGVEVRAGDYNDKEQLISGLQGVDVVLLISSNDYSEKRVAQHKNVIDAAQEAGVERCVFAGVTGELLGTTFDPILETMHQTETYLQESALVWTIARNNLYIEPDFQAAQHYIKAGKIANAANEGKCGYTTREELAHAYGCLMAQEGHEGRIYELAGEPIKQQTLAHIINDTFGVNINYEVMDVDSYEEDRVSALGEHLGKIISGIYHGIRLGNFEKESDFEQITGRKHISMLEYFLQNKS